MMKKLLSLLLCLVLCLGVFATFGCSEEEETDAPVNEIINPFDTQKQLNSMQLRNLLGKAELNTTETDYIKSGEGSLKVTVEAEPLVSGKMPLLYQGMNQTTIGRPNFTNFSEIGNVTMDVYSAQEEKTRVGLQLIYDYDPWGSSIKDNIKWFEVSKGWNTLNVVTLREYMPLDAEGARTVEMIAITFERGEADRVYYLDDLKQIKTHNDIKTIQDFRGANEIASYDEEWQIHYTQALAIDEYNTPVFEQNLDPTYTKDGRGGSLKATFPKPNGNDYPSIILDDKLLGTKDFSKYKDSDRLTFDVYLPAGSVIDRMSVIMGAANAQQQFAPEYSETLEQGVWNKISYKVGDLRNVSPSDTVNFNNMRYFRICLDCPTDQVVLYVDNIRMEIVN